MKKSALRGGFRLPSTLFLGVLALAGSGLPAARGADATWTGNQNGNFATGGNWNTNSAPGSLNNPSLDTATFNLSGNTAIQLPSATIYYLGSIVFGSGGSNASAYTFGNISSNFELALSASGSPAYTNSSGPGGVIQINSAVTNAQTFNVKLALTPGTFTFANNGASSATLNFSQQIRSTTTAGKTSTLTLAGSNTSANTISGPIVNGAGAGMILNKTGAGFWILSGANTYTGGTTFGGGTLQAGSAGALGTTGTLSFTGGTLQYSAANQTDYSSRFSTAAGQLYSVDTNGQNVTFASALSSAGGSLTKLGAGTLTLNSFNTTGSLNLAGGSVVSAGAGNAVNFLNAEAGGTVNLTVAGGTTLTVHGGPLSGPNAVRVTNGTTLNVAGNVNVESGPLAIGRDTPGSGTLNLTGGTLDADRSPSGDYAYLRVGGGSGVVGTVQQSGSSVVKTGGAYILGLDSGTGIHNVTGSSELKTGGVWTGGFHLYIGLNQSAGQTGTSGTLTISDNGKFTLGATSYLDVGVGLYGAPTGGNGTITQNGAGSVVTFGGDFAAFGSQSAGGTGTYNLQAGTLNLTHGTVSFGDFAGATGILNQSGGTLTATTGLTVGTAGTGTYNLSGGNATFNNGLTVGAQAGSVGTVTQTGGTLTMAGGTLNLAQSNSVYNLNDNGLTNASRIRGTLAVGGNGGITGAGTLSLGGGILQVTGSSLTTGVNVALAANTSSLLNTGAFNATFTGPVNGAAGQLDKIGTGSVAFNNASNAIGSLRVAGGSVGQTVGTLTSSEVAVGTGAGNTGSYVLSGGSLVLPGTTPPTIVGGGASSLRVGDFGGTGTFTQTGGTASVIGSLNIGNRNGSNGTYAISGGTLDFGGQGTGNSVLAVGRTRNPQSGPAETSNAAFNISGTAAVNILAGNTQTSYFYVGGDDDNRSTGAVGIVNQTGGTVTVAPGATLGFGYGNGTYNLNGGTLAVGGNSLNTAFGTYAFNLGAGTLRVTGSSLTTGFNYNATATGAAFTTVDTNGSNATFTGNLTGAGNILKTGAGTLTASGTNSLGALIVQAGNGTNGAGSTSVGLLGVGYYAGTSGNFDVTAGQVNVSAPGNNGDLTIGGGAGSAGHLTVSGGTVNVGGAGSFGRAFVGTFGGTGTVDQSGGAVNVTGPFNVGNRAGATGTYNLSGGTLTVGASASPGNNGLTLGRSRAGDAVTSGTLNVSGSGTLVLNADAPLLIGGDTFPASDTANSVGVVNQSGAGSRVTANSYIALGSNGTGTYNLNGGTLEVGGGTNGIQRGSGTANLNLGGGTLRVINADLTANVPVNLGAGTYSFVNTNGFNAALSGGLSGANGSLVKIGAGTLNLDGAPNTPASLLVAGGGVAQASGTTTSYEVAVGTGAGNNGSYLMTGGALVLAGGTPPSLVGGGASSLRVGDFGGTGTFTQTGGTVTVNGSFNVGNQGGTGTYDISNGTLNVGDGNGLASLGRTTSSSTGGAASAGTLLVSGTAQVNVTNDSFIVGDRDGTGAQGSGTLTQTGGTISVTGANSKFFLGGYGSSTYNLNGGALEVGGSALRGAYNGSPDTYGFNLGGGTLRVIGSSLTTDVRATLAGSTTSTVDTNGFNAALTGPISGTGNLVKAGAGTLTFTANNTFSGTATVNAGTLEAANTGALGGTGGIVVNNGGTLLLSGAGNVNRINDNAPVTLNGGTVAVANPGNTAANAVLEGTGVSNQNGTVSGANNTGLGSLTLAANSYVDFSGGAGTLTFAGFLPGGFTLSILNYASTAQISASGVFSGMDGTDSRLIFASDQVNNLGSFSFGGIGAQEINLGGGYFEVIPVPEPGTVLAGILTAGAFGWHGRRRFRTWREAGNKPVAA